MADGNEFLKYAEYDKMLEFSSKRASRVVDPDAEDEPSSSSSATSAQTSNTAQPHLGKLTEEETARGIARELMPGGPIEYKGVTFIEPPEARLLFAYIHLPKGSLTDANHGHATDGHSVDPLTLLPIPALDKEEIAKREAEGKFKREQIVALAEEGGLELAPRGYPVKHAWTTKPDVGLLFRSRCDL